MFVGAVVKYLSNSRCTLPSRASLSAVLVKPCTCAMCCSKSSRVGALTSTAIWTWCRLQRVRACITIWLSANTRSPRTSLTRASWARMREAE